MLVALGLLTLHHPHLLCICLRFKVCPFKRTCLDFPFRVKLTPLGCISGKEAWPGTGMVATVSCPPLILPFLPFTGVSNQMCFGFGGLVCVPFSERLQVLFLSSGPVRGNPYLSDKY